MAENCEGCKFYLEEPGLCRRNPPRAVALQEEYYSQAGISHSQSVVASYYPAVCLGGWCGEFVQKKPVTLRDLADRK